MSSEPQLTKFIEVFYSYSHRDEEWRDKLRKYLVMLKREGTINEWYDRKISAGDDWKGQIDEHLDSAHIILLLVSADFLLSDYCYDVEVRRAMERHVGEAARVVPIILRACEWKRALFGNLKVLPKDAKPIEEWEYEAQAYMDIAESIREIIKEICEEVGTYQEPCLSQRPSSFHTPPPSSIPGPPVVGFVARRNKNGSDIVERLKKELAPREDKPKRGQLITLLGPGGVGKTTIAAEAARALESEFGRRIVWSGAEGRADFILSTLLDDIATQFEREDLRRLADHAKQSQQVRKLVADSSTLIVVDNYETILPDAKKSIESWFAIAGCSAIFTSRERILWTRNFPLAAMLHDEAQNYLEKLVEQTLDTQIFSEKIRRRILETAGSNPHVIQWIVGQIDEAKEPSSVFEELGRGEGHAAERVFDRSFNLPQVGADGRAALLALSLFMPSASREALAKVAGFGEDSRRVDEAITVLYTLWLIKGVDEHRRFTIEGLMRHLAEARLLNDQRDEEFRRRFVGYFRAYAVAHAKPTSELYDALEKEKENIMRAMDIAAEQEDWESVQLIGDILARGMLFVRGYWDEALRRGKEALDAARITQDEKLIALSAHNVAVMLRKRGDLPEAGRLFDESLAIKKRLENQSGIAVTLYQMGILAYDQGELFEAKRLFNESLKIAEGLNDQECTAAVIHELGRLAHKQGKLIEAMRLYNVSLEIEKSLGNQAGIAATLHSLGLLAQDQGELAKARKLYDESLSIKETLGDQSGIAITLGQLGNMAFLQGDSTEARRLYIQSLNISRRLGSQNGIASTLHQLGRLAQAQGELEETRRLYNESLEINKGLGNQSVIASTLHQLGRLAQAQGELEETRRLYNESLEINKRLGNQSSIASTLNALGVLAFSQGELEEARRLYDESMEIDKRLGNQSGIASTLNALGVLAFSQSELEEARRLYNESMEISKRLGKQSVFASTLHELGRLAQAQGELEEARRLYNESLEINKGLGNQSGIASTLHQLGRLAQAQGELEETLRLYNESLEITKKLGDQSSIARTLGQLGLLAEKVGNREEAVRLLREALGIFEKLKSPDAEIARRNLKRLEGGSS